MSTVEATAAPAADPVAERGSWLRRLLLSEYLVLLLTALYVAAMVPLVARDRRTRHLARHPGRDDAAPDRRHRPGLRPDRRRHRSLGHLEPRHLQRARRRGHDPRRRAYGLGAALARDRRGHRRLRRGRRAARLAQRRLHHALQHAALHRDADDDDVLLRPRHLVHDAAHARRQLDRQPAAGLRLPGPGPNRPACRSRC